MNDSVCTDAAEQLAAEYLGDLTHSKQVAKLAASLFDECAKLHYLGTREKTLLATAALVHDVGWREGQLRHHKRAFDVVLDRPPDGLSPRETLIVANVARYHRKALPKLSHPGFARLAPPDRETVRRLGALLRIADGLDVTHRSVTRSLTCVSDANTATIEVAADGDCSMEIQAAKKKSDLFEQAFGKKVRFRVTGGNCGAVD